MMDLNGHIISWNTGAERILGYQVEIIGQPFREFFFTRKRLSMACLKALRDGGKVSWDNRFNVREMAHSSGLIAS